MVKANNIETERQIEPNERDRLNTLTDEYCEFAYVVSHDLQAPFRQLRGLTESLIDSINITNPQQEATKEMIEHIAEQAEKTLDALLVFSRFNTDEKNFECLNPEKIIKESLNHLGIRDHKLNSIVHIQENMAPIYGDRKLIIQAFYHLIDNALKFQPPGQKPKIKISQTVVGNESCFHIEDNGIGMKPDQVEQAFIILRKLESEKQYPGRGVGLTFAKKIAEIHKGHLTLTTAPNKGTTAHLSCNIGPNDQFQPFRIIE